MACSHAVMNESVSGGRGCGQDRTWPVCSKRSGDNVSGLCDVSGNVEEWTQTAFDSNNRVVRGGSWIDGLQRNFGPTARRRQEPAFKHIAVGFRCVKDTP